MHLLWLAAVLAASPAHAAQPAPKDSAAFPQATAALPVLPGDPQLVSVVAQRMVRHREIPPVKHFPDVGEPPEIALGIESPQDFDRLARSPGQPSEQSPEHLKLWEARQSRSRVTQDPRCGLVIPSTGRELRIQLKAVQQGELVTMGDERATDGVGHRAT